VKLLTRLCMTVLALATVFAVADGGSMSAQFTDRVNSTGAGLTAATLPAPVNVAASLVGGATVSAQVAWDADAGDFATGWQVFRNVGPCSGWTPSGLPYATLGTAIPRSYSDSAISAGNTYCYAVRGTYQTWTSPFGATTSSQVAYQDVRLFTNFTGSAYQVVTPAPGAGSSETFGCLVQVVVILGCQGGTAAGPYTFGSTSTYRPLSSSGWDLRLGITGETILSLGSITIQADIWYQAAATTCTLPAVGSSTRIASGSHAFTGLVGLLAVLTGDYNIAMTADPNFAAPGLASTVCMQLSTSPSLATLAARIVVNNGGLSWVEGPLAP
jgi:hypothetical protein